LLVVAVPLVLSTGVHTLQLVVDRLFLTWHSTDAVAAAMPAGILCFTISALFIGTATYSGTFIAQYFGAGRPERIGPTLWQGIYVMLIGAAALVGISFAAAAIFDFIGHAPNVRRLEADYFRIISRYGGIALMSSVLGGFYSGRGRTWPVFWISILATGVNLVLDYAMIFGNWGFPEMGIRGAAVATVLSSCVSLAVYILIFIMPHNNRVYHTISGWRIDRELFWRLVRFGFPNGLHFFIDIAGFSAVLLLLGRLGKTEQAATSIAFNINMLAFLPMIGMGIGVSVLVGQFLGKNEPERAVRVTWSGFHITALYMGVFAAAYFFAPGLFIAPYAAKADPTEFKAISEITMVLLRFIAVYSVFDAMNIIFAAGIKGAGDTKYVMVMITVMSSLLLVLPTWLVVEVFHGNIYIVWAILTVYVILLAFAFLRRFLGGKWKTMRVIEEIPPSVEPALPESPVVGP